MPARRANRRTTSRLAPVNRRETNCDQVVFVDTQVNVIPYELGDLFAAPLRNGGLAVCIVVRWEAKKRRSLKGVDAFGFGTLYQTPPKLSDIARLTVFDAIHHVCCGDRAMSTEKWLRIGALAGFRLQNWPIPPHLTGDRMSVIVEEDEYQNWHREYDNNVVAWIKKHDRASEQQFMRYLRNLYKKNDLKKWFPNGF